MKTYISKRLLVYRNSLLISTSLLLFCFAARLPAQTAGSLDPTFNGTGIVRTAFGNSHSEPNGIAVQPDGKIIVSGIVYSSSILFAVVRYNPNGSLDATFGTGGKVITPVGLNVLGGAVAIQSDGKIVVAGMTENPTYDFTVLRYNANGSLDNSFGSGGIVITAMGSDNDFAESVALQSDGKIVVVGSSYNGSNMDYAVARYNTNGSLDTSFDGDGKIIKHIANDDFGRSVAFQSDGKILVNGSSNFGGRYNFVTMRFNTNGSLDTTFVPNGIVISPVGSNAQARDIVVQPNDKFLVVGGVVINGTWNFGLVRYDSLGLFDNYFGSVGQVFTPIYNAFDSATSVVLQTNGKIVVGGNACTTDRCDLTIARYNPNGTLDTTFDFDGKVTVPVEMAEQNVQVAIQPDGNIVAAGSSAVDNSDGSRIDFAVVRFLAGGDSNKFDFDGDGRSDISVFRPADGIWYLNKSASGFSAVQFGTASDKLAPADYDGDSKTDVAVFRNGIWHLNRSRFGFASVAFGEATDIPQPADFDRDGVAELAVFRPSNGTWYIYNLVNRQLSAVQFGMNGDKPVVSDYDADGKADVAVFRPSTGTWYLQRSQLGFTSVQFGESSDTPVPADYDGDRKTDVAVFRSSTGTWYLQRSLLGFTGIVFGAGTDIPTPGDYDGDGRADVAVFRNGTWYLIVRRKDLPALHSVRQRTSRCQMFLFPEIQIRFNRKAWVINNPHAFLC
jgi:uncharacterized delta-60 repeat protein